MICYHLSLYVGRIVSMDARNCVYFFCLHHILVCVNEVRCKQQCSAAHMPDIRVQTYKTQDQKCTFLIRTENKQARPFWASVELVGARTCLRNVSTLFFSNCMGFVQCLSQSGFFPLFSHAEIYVHIRFLENPISAKVNAAS